MLRGTSRLNQIGEFRLNLHQLCLGLTALCPRGSQIAAGRRKISLGAIQGGLKLLNLGLGSALLHNSVFLGFTT